MTPYCHIHKKDIGPNRNYYRIYFEWVLFTFAVWLLLVYLINKRAQLKK